MRRAALVTLLFVSAALGSVAAQTYQQKTERERDTWQHVPELFTAANVRPGAVIADIGAGDGFLTVRLSAAVGPSGKVYAVDTDARAVRNLRDRVAAAQLTNVEVIEGAATDPHLPAGACDGVIMLNAYHEITEGVAMLSQIGRALKPAGRLVISDPLPTQPASTRAAQMREHELAPTFIVDDLHAAGLQIFERRDTFATSTRGARFGVIIARRGR
jgi:precorrin-6B methylase 2